MGDAKSGAPDGPGDGATYLASDILSLAKVVAHFKFDKGFSKGLHQLILSIRRQKRVTRLSSPKRNNSSGKAEGDKGGVAKKQQISGGATGRAGNDAGALANEPAAAPPPRKRPRMVN